jgi:phage regulator Rha-like protein
MLIKFEDENIELIKNENYEFLLSNFEVAKGFGVDERVIRDNKSNHKDELIEGKHFVTITQENAKSFGIELPPKVRTKTFWTKRGVVRLGFFIKSERAKKFRDWAEDLIIGEISEEREVIENDLVEIVQNELRVSHCDIAYELGYNEKLLRNTITKHISAFETFGKVYFEEEPRLNLAGAINQKRIYFPNEQQTNLLLTFLRKSEKLLKLKVKLISEFSKKREALLISKLEEKSLENISDPKTIRKYRKFNREFIKLIELFSNVDEKTLSTLEKVNREIFGFSPTDFLKLNLAK